jgi:ABC-type oligopeptide transport system substrate-binding subunit
MRAKRATWIVGASAIALAATACGSSGGGGSKVPAGYYTASSTQPQNPLQPANANETGGSYALDVLFRGLYTYDTKTGASVPAMAADLQSPDNQNWTVKIKSGWTFHNGEPVTAKSFVDAWNWGARPENKQINASWFAKIDGYDAVHPSPPEGSPEDTPAPAPTAKELSGLKVVDDTTFTIKTSRPISAFKSVLAYKPFMPLPQEFYKDPEKYGKEPIGNGPFILDKENGGWQQKKSITFKAWDKYAGDDKPKSKGLRQEFYTGYDAAYTALRDNKLDVIDQMPEAANATFKKDLGDRAVFQAQMTIQKIGFPFYDPKWKALKDPNKVRQGVSMAINRQAIVDGVYAGNRVPATDWLVQGMPGNTDILGDIGKYNPEKAKALIAEGGGIPDNKLTISYNADGPHKVWVDAVCNSINQALGGQICEGKSYPTMAQLRDDVTGDKMTSMYRTAWQGDYPFPDNFLEDIYGTGAASNDSGFSSAKFDALSKQAQSAKTTEESVQLWQQAEREMAKEMPSIPLWYYATTAGYSKNVENVNFNVFGTPVWTDITKK